MSKELKDLAIAGEEIKQVLKKFLATYQEAEDSTDSSLLSVEERSTFNTLYQVQDKISDAYRLLEHLDKSVKAEGNLEKLSNGRYEVEGIELTSGSPVDYFSEDSDGGCYIPSRVEHSGEDYYIFSLGKSKKIEGLKVRIK